MVHPRGRGRWPGGGEPENNLERGFVRSNWRHGVGGRRLTNGITLSPFSKVTVAPQPQKSASAPYSTVLALTRQGPDVGNPAGKSCARQIRAARDLGRGRRGGPHSRPRQPRAARRHAVCRASPALLPFDHGGLRRATVSPPPGAPGRAAFSQRRACLPLERQWPPACVRSAVTAAVADVGALSSSATALPPASRQSPLARAWRLRPYDVGALLPLVSFPPFHCATGDGPPWPARLVSRHHPSFCQRLLCVRAPPTDGRQRQPVCRRLVGVCPFRGRPAAFRGRLWLFNHTVAPPSCAATAAGAPRHPW